MEPILSPIDMAIAWHGRLMVLAWVFLFPAGILIARFFKVTPRQNWPTELDNRFWWHSHLLLQYLGGLVVLSALALILLAPEDAYRQGWLHRSLGWLIIVLCVAQFLSGLLRGSKGGPDSSDPAGSIAGDHYDMTRRRRVFEAFHRSNGYLLVLLSIGSVITGLATAMAPVWMLPLLVCWWLLCIALFIHLQRRGLYMGSYQAIWGPHVHPPARTDSSTQTRQDTIAPSTASNHQQAPHHHEHPR